MKKVLALMFAIALSIAMSSFALAQATTGNPADKKEETKAKHHRHHHHKHHKKAETTKDWTK
jgi:uncharacterized protein YxeA